MKNIFITGGGGYVGAELTDFLISKGYNVTVYDLFLYGKDVFFNKKNIRIIKGDIRDIDNVKLNLKGQDAVIHLACISNDTSFELNPNLGKSINFYAFEPIVTGATKDEFVPIKLLSPIIVLCLSFPS